MDLDVLITMKKIMLFLFLRNNKSNFKEFGRIKYLRFSCAICKGWNNYWDPTQCVGAIPMYLLIILFIYEFRQTVKNVI